MFILLNANHFLSSIVESFKKGRKLPLYESPFEKGGQGGLQCKCLIYSAL
jgi:hypothetical protein